MNKIKKSNSNKPFIIISLILLTICILLSSVLGLLYIKNSSPQIILQKLGIIEPQQELDLTLFSWNRSIEQLNYDADIVFIGDSLTIEENFQEYFINKKIINLGLYADTLYGISERTYLINKFTPEMIFIEGGINSLSSHRVEDVASFYESMVVNIKRNNPNAKLYIQSVLPISNKNESLGLTNKNIISLNEKLKEIASRNNITYVDIYSIYVLDGEMNPEYTTDGIHLKDAYKHLWLEALSDYIK